MSAGEELLITCMGSTRDVTAVLWKLLELIPVSDMDLVCWS